MPFAHIGDMPNDVAILFEGDGCLSRWGIKRRGESSSKPRAASNETTDSQGEMGF